MVVCAPSGSGKTSICRAFMRRNSRSGYSISLTTRLPRSGEVDGVDYRFVNSEEFQNVVDRGEFVEYEKVHGSMYGTRKEDIDTALNKGNILLIDIDVHGGRAIKNEYPDDTITIFIKPSSVEELKRRLQARGTESEEKIIKRLERYEYELLKAKDFDIIIENEDFDVAVNDFENAINNKGGI